MSVDWIWQAPCAGADPDLFTTTDPTRAAEVIAAYCARCPFTRQCVEQVDPRPLGFDGIAGGHVYSRGYRLDLRLPPTITARCGTNSGYCSHAHRREQPCADCREAHRIYNRDRYLASLHTDDELGEAV